VAGHGLHVTKDSDTRPGPSACSAASRAGIHGYVSLNHPTATPYDWRHTVTQTPTPDPVPAPTQTRHPWRATARTVFALIVAAATLLPYVVTGLHVDSTVIGAQILAVTGGITRVLAIPAVDVWLTDNLGGVLAAEPRVP
jgi:hypothetical protein